jgi:methylated-DNA-protein-cysteine methyltransferase related protein
MKAESTYQRIYRAVAKIPRGKVATYGQIAELAGFPRAARQVGYALAALRDDWKNVPWHRVINARGTISLRGGKSGFEGLQEAMLRKEGVRFDSARKVSLAKFRWDGSEVREVSAKSKNRSLPRAGRRPAKKGAAKRSAAVRKGTPAATRKARTTEPRVGASSQTRTATKTGTKTKLR